MGILYFFFLFSMTIYPLSIFYLCIVRRSLVPLMAMLLTVTLSEIIKHLVKRPRPQFAHPPRAFANSKSTGTKYAYPSGDTAASVVLATLLLPDYLFIKVMLPPFVSMARIYFRMHYVFDCASGVVLGYLVTSFLQDSVEVNQVSDTIVSTILQYF